MELLAHYTSNEIVVSLAIYAAGVISGVLLAWAARVRTREIGSACKRRSQRRENGPAGVAQAPRETPKFPSGGGLLPAIAQDAETGQVLMLAWMNAEAYQETLRTGQAVYYSRSRRKLWRKGEESGHTQAVESIHLDCDADTILLRVRQTGPACHEGYPTCFFRQVTPDGLRITQTRLVPPSQAYASKKRAQ